MAADVLEVSVAFTETCCADNIPNTTDTDNTPIAVPANQVSAKGGAALLRIHAICPGNGLALVLFDGPGIRSVGLPLLELSRTLADSTAAAAQSVNSQIQSSYRMIATILPFLTDERICAELLQSVRRKKK
jgi:hypothetical protein